MSQILQESDLAFALQRASQAMSLVYREGRSLDQAIYHVLNGVETAQARGAIQDLSYFGMRNLGRGLVLARLLSNKQELNPKSLTELLALALALLWPTELPKYAAHTVVNQTVNACAAHAVFKRAKGLVNACLRSFLRDLSGWSQKALHDPEAEFNMPRWWLDCVRSQHPEHWRILCAQAQMQPPLVLRVNARWGSPAQYVQRAEADGLVARVVGPQAVWIEKAVSVDRLPGFEAGHVSVQDTAAQLAAPLLGLEDGQRVLDACAAPGGKSGHLLESANIHLLALDISEARLSRVYDNVDRVAATLLPLGAWSFSAKVAPVQAIKQWWDGQPFDAILADVPCSGSGVVRRHPDIPWLRREEDVANLSHIQHEILTALWSTLRPGGKLLLVTCSIFREEGPLLSKRFEEQHVDAIRLPAPGWVLPHAMAGVDDLAASPDGFFYALFQKRLEP